MRHRKKINHLSRKAPHRKAMLANMASSLILHKRITTTTARAKALRSFVEPVITRSREDSTHSRRMAFRDLRDKDAVSELFRDVAAKVGERPGGYTRIIKLGNRIGDSADMCIIELVDYNENLLSDKSAAKQKSTRRRRGGKKKEQAGTATVARAGKDVPEAGEPGESLSETPETDETADTTEAAETPETAEATETVAEEAGSGAESAETEPGEPADTATGKTEPETGEGETGPENKAEQESGTKDKAGEKEEEKKDE